MKPTTLRMNKNLTQNSKLNQLETLLKLWQFSRQHHAHLKLSSITTLIFFILILFAFIDSQKPKHRPNAVSVILELHECFEKKHCTPFYLKIISSKSLWKKVLASLYSQCFYIKSKKVTRKQFFGNKSIFLFSEKDFCA